MRKKFALPGLFLAVPMFCLTALPAPAEAGLHTQCTTHASRTDLHRHSAKDGSVVPCQQSRRYPAKHAKPVRDNSRYDNSSYRPAISPSLSISVGIGGISF